MTFCDSKRQLIDEENLSFLASLSRVIDPETGEKLNSFKFKSEASNVILGGFITTGRQMAWIFTFFTFYPESEEKILKELESHNLIGSQARKLEYSDISKLTYLDAFVKVI